jgi:hypothetical protein
MSEEIEVETNNKKTKLASFIRKHHKLMTFFGALIVFVTFIVKDGIRDHLKDQAASIDSAESLFIITKNMRVPPDVAKRLDGVGKIKFDDVLDRAFAVMTDVANYAEASVQTSSRLLNSLPGKVEEEQKLASLRERLYSDHTKMQFKHVSLLDSRIINEGTKNKVVVPNDILDEMSKLMVDSDEATRIGDQLLLRAEEMKDKTAKRYRIASIASNWLYTLGWGLGLIGRIYGVAGGGAE